MNSDNLTYKSSIEESIKKTIKTDNDVLRNQLVNEINETNSTPKKKFTVTKLFQELSISPKSLFDESELFKQQSSNQHEFSKSCMVLSENNQNEDIDDTSLFNSNNNNVNDLDFNREIEDDFNTNEVFDSEMSAINGNRYAEGQDTITSLKNSVFINKLNEIKNKRNKANKNKPTPATSTQSINTDSSTYNSISGDIPQTPQPKRALLIRSDSSLSTLNSKKKLPILSRRGSRVKTTSESTSVNISPGQLIETLNAIENDEIEVEDDAIELKKTLLLTLQNEKEETIRKRKVVKHVAKTLACFFLLLTFVIGMITIIT